MEKMTADKYLFGILRISLGFVFFWAFLDKMFGLGHATTRDGAIINGGKATEGFLAFGTTESPFHEFFKAIAGEPITEFLFMLGLFAIGLALILGIGVRIAGYSGGLMMFLMYLASIPLENNPLIDDHIVYMFALIYFAHTKVGNYLGFGAQWRELDLVKNYPVLA